MTIISLKGRGNIGKTTSIRLLHDLLLHNSFNLLSTIYNTSGGGFTSVFTKNGKIIGIASWGDSEHIVWDKLNEYINQGCQIRVCACRSRGGTIKAIKSFTQCE